VRTVQVSKNIVQFSTFFEPINLTFNQYLIKGSSPVLIQTGAVSLVKDVISAVEAHLQGQALKYLFVSHFESDECGGLGILLDSYPGVQVLCSETSARQITGFGITQQVLPQKAGGTLKEGDLNLQFIAYPSEMHGWEGLIVVDKASGVLFSSDLFIRSGHADIDALETTWDKELASLAQDRMLPAAAAPKMLADLKALNVSRVATGHGPYLKLV